MRLSPLVPRSVSGPRVPRIARPASAGSRHLDREQRGRTEEDRRHSAARRAPVRRRAAGPASCRSWLRPCSIGVLACGVLAVEASCLVVVLPTSGVGVRRTLVRGRHRPPARALERLQAKLQHWHARHSGRAGRRQLVFQRTGRSVLRTSKLCFLVAAACLAVTAPAQASVAHTVEPGETLWSIAAASNLTTRTLAAANGLPDDAQVVVGSTIQVPSVQEGAAALVETGRVAAPAAAPVVAPEPEPGAPQPAGAYTVQPGDTLASIAVAQRHRHRSGRMDERPRSGRRAAGRDRAEAADRRTAGPAAGAAADAGRTRGGPGCRAESRPPSR